MGTIRTSAHILSVPTAMLLATTAAIAQAPGAAIQTAQSAAAAPEQSSSGLQDIVVTARRVSESAQSTPISITTVGAQTLRYNVIQQAKDIQNITPSLSIMTNSVAPAGLQLALRGQAQIATDASIANSVGVYLDDTFIGTSSLAGGVMNLRDLERVEVLKGPQGTLYGRNVTGGVIKFVTKKPELGEFNGALTGGVGNYRRRFGEALVNVPVGDNVALRVLGSVDNHDGYSYDTVNKRGLDNQRKWNVRGSLLIKPSVDDSILLQGWYGRFRGNGPDARTSYIQPGINVGSLNILGYQAHIGQPINGVGLPDLAALILGANAGFTPAQIAAAGGKVAAALPAVDALIDQYLKAPRSKGAQSADIRNAARARQGGAALTLTHSFEGSQLKSITAYDYGYRDGYYNVGGGPWQPISTNSIGQIKQHRMVV